jgi:hypothetical protein
MMALTINLKYLSRVSQPEMLTDCGLGIRALMMTLNKITDVEVKNGFVM